MKEGSEGIEGRNAVKERRTERRKDGRKRRREAKKEGSEGSKLRKKVMERNERKE